MDYFSILIQDFEAINELDALGEKFKDNEDFNLCAYACDLYCGIGFEDDEDNYTSYKPYIAKGSDIVIDTYRGYTLVRNLAIGGAYMLYCEVNDD